MAASKPYRVTYKGTRKTHAYATKKAALDQARWAIGFGNGRACVQKRGAGGWLTIKCLTRRRRRKG